MLDISNSFSEHVLQQLLILDGAAWNDFKIEFSVQLGPKFMKENGFKHVTFSTADGALEAAPAV